MNRTITVIGPSYVVDKEWTFTFHYGFRDDAAQGSWEGLLMWKDDEGDSIVVAYLSKFMTENLLGRAAEAAAMEEVRARIYLKVRVS